MESVSLRVPPNIPSMIGAGDNDEDVMHACDFWIARTCNQGCQQDF